MGQPERDRKESPLVPMMLPPRELARARAVWQHHQHNWGFVGAFDAPLKLARFQAIPKTPPEPYLSASGLLLLVLRMRSSRTTQQSRRAVGEALSELPRAPEEKRRFDDAGLAAPAAP